MEFSGIFFAALLNRRRSKRDTCMNLPRQGRKESGDRVGAMIKSVFTIVAALMVAAIVSLASLPPQVQARAPELGARGDRVDARPIGTACSQREWPYFEAACLRDAKNPFGQARQVRHVWIDQLPRAAEDPVVAR